MATEIDRDTELILRTLYTWSVGTDDQEVGRHSVTATELLKVTNLSSQRLEDAVALLGKRAYVEAVTSIGGLLQVDPTPSGRAEFQRMMDQATAAPTPEEMGDSPYDVFLSHAAEDDELAARVAQVLRASGITVFTTGPGFPTGIWSEEVRAALEESEHYWLLLTEKALDRSVYVHHEFGYFFGYHRRTNSKADVRLVARRLRYILKRGAGRRPGMYQHFQDFPIQDFDDPVSIARIITKEIGKDFKEPQNPEEFRIAASGWTALPPDGLDNMQIVRSSSGAAPDYSHGTCSVDVTCPKAIFNVSAVGWHNQVHVWPLKPLPQVGATRKEQLALIVEWAKGEKPPQELQDSYKRRFPFQRPRDPGPPWAPLYVTFETQSGEVWAAVAYMRVERQQHGHPETSLLFGPHPFGWVRGQRT